MKQINEKDLNLEEIFQLGTTNLHIATALPGFQKGVYFLWYQGEIVYIGKSVKSLFLRMYNHSSGRGRQGMKLFDQITFYGPYLSESDIHVLEVYLINLHKPKYNLDSFSSSKLQLEIEIPEEVEQASITFDYYSYALRVLMNETRGEDIMIKRATNHNPLTYEKA